MWCVVLVVDMPQAAVQKMLVRYESTVGSCNSVWPPR